LQHNGIFDAFEEAKKVTPSNYLAPTREMVTAKFKESTDSQHIIVGHVLDYFEVPNGGFYVLYQIHAAWESIEWMVINGAAAGLSMTHFPLDKGGTDIIPYEVSLCFEPARPHCYTVVGSPGIQPVLDYKRRLISGDIPDGSDTIERPLQVTIMADMETEQVVSTTPAENTPIESAIGSIPDESQRKIVMARLASMQRFAEEAELTAEKVRKENGSLQTKLSQASQGHDNEKMHADLLKNQLAIITASIGADKVATYHTQTEPIHKQIDDKNFTGVINSFERVLCAANRQIMELQESKGIVPAQSAQKRTAGDQLTPGLVEKIEERAAMDATTPAAELKAASGTSQRVPLFETHEVLRRAMSRTGETFRGTQMDVPFA
jgi:hypothetical protein